MNDPAHAASAPADDDPLHRPSLPIRSSDTPDPAVVRARDVATTGQIIEALVCGQLAIVGMATLSAHLRVYDAAHPERQVAAEGPGRLVELVTFIGAVAHADLQVVQLRADGPVVRARFTVTGELRSPFRTFQPGDRIGADVTSTYRYDTYGLLIEQWVDVAYRTSVVASETHTKTDVVAVGGPALEHT